MVQLVDEETMRIIGGTLRGHKIKQPDSRGTRPTKDRIREAVFNMLMPYMDSAGVLDIFAGSGAYGLESLSRGAGKAALVDNDETACKTIEENIKFLGLEDKTHIIKKDFFSPSFKDEFNGNDKYDIVFADPPFLENMAKKTLITIDYYDIVNRPGIVVIEHHSGETIEDVCDHVTLLKEKTYKDIVISVYSLE